MVLNSAWAIILKEGTRRGRGYSGDLYVDNSTMEKRILKALDVCVIQLDQDSTVFFLSRQ
jgi:hypothetical protein